MSLRARRRALVIAGSTVITGFALMAPAYAASSGPSATTTARPATPRTASGAHLQPGGAMRHTTRPQTALSGVKNTTTSTNWSGYAATGSTFTSVASSWTEPSGTCSSGDQYSSFWVGLDGYNSNSVEQTGTDTDCAGRTPEYYAWYEMYPAGSVEINHTVRPGDQISASVTYTGSSSFTLRIADSTEGWTYSTSKKLSGAPRSSTEVIAEAPCCTANGGILPLADFGTVNFTGSTANGATLSSFNPTGIDMVSASGRQEDSISSLNGGSFSAKWLSKG
ncbi:MAG TPA: G1 family glutamic endopeptidase [Streptosporangiaceae bacterium]